MEHKFRWIVDNPNDTIQNYHYCGEIFEKEEVEFLASKINDGDVVIDIGANVGNHAIYLSKMTKAKTIYVIEPIPHTCRILLANVALNYAHNINIDYLGYALGHIECAGYPFMAYGKDNLGGMQLSPTPMDGLAPKDHILDPVPVVPGDKFFKDKKIDFIKMDAETMEVFILEGMKDTIDKNRPRMYIEVAVSQSAEFFNWIKDNKYRIEYTYDTHSKNVYSNHYIVPE